MKKAILLLFVIVASGNLISNVIENENLELYTKPALIPILMIYMVVASPEKKALLNFTLGALLFSWLGDVILMFQERGENYFIFGLVSFLLAHLIYIFTYRKAKWSVKENGLLPTQRMRYIFILVLAGCGLVYVLLPNLGGLTVPVTVYASVIVTMTIVALDRYGHTSKSSFGWVFFGALLFMLSDSILAINRFLDPVPMAGFWIMLTYIAAQFCIVQGLLYHPKQVKAATL
ncbi:YhhN family protein [Fulvivirga imtechensis AK7]|uniref:YhhN family protein n=1 Tax=Fulvivirga imtechensis AK7 TaxID=1237149 RepID=L8JJM0_9BACT|nr:lysoplasmalogenase [Fulvivirga imtechensis]ELR69106.1 YhhN family protein [Fulvivirga imtechensis AK7]